jgi:hypothetical protein
MIAIDTQRKVLDAVDANFDAQLATTKEFVAIPSTRGAEGPCQEMIGDLLRQRGYEVDDWHIDVNELKIRAALARCEGYRPHPEELANGSRECAPDDRLRKRLEGWTQRRDSRPSFETRPRGRSSG